MTNTSVDNEKLRVLMVKEDGEKLDSQIINTPENFEHIVDGLFEVIFLSDDIILFVNDYKMGDSNRETSFQIIHFDDTIVSLVRGVSFFAAVNENREVTSLSDSQVELVKDNFITPYEYNVAEAEGRWVIKRVFLAPENVSTNIEGIEVYIVPEDGERLYSQIINTPASHEQLVEGKFEVIDLSDNIILFVNDEYMANETIPVTFKVVLAGRVKVSLVRGTSFFAGTNDNRDILSLSDKQKEIIAANFVLPTEYASTDALGKWVTEPTIPAEKSYKLDVIAVSQADDKLRSLKIPHSIESFEFLVGGGLSIIDLSGNIVLFVNDEKMADASMHSFTVVLEDQTPVALISGDAFFAGIGQDENFISLTDGQKEIIHSNFITPKHYKVSEAKGKWVL